MAIVIVPPYPKRNDPSFATVADSWNSQLPTWTDQVNATAVDVASKATTATTQAGIATTQAGLATTNGAAQVALAADQVTLATTQAGIATTKAQEASASAASAVLAPGTSATSSTSNTIGTGSKTFTIQTGKLFVAGMTLKADSSGQWMIGNVTSYNSGTGELILNITNIFGSGTLNSWTVSISAPMPDVPGGYSVFSFNNFI